MLGITTIGIKTGIGIVRQGTLLNQIPFKADALVWLDGTINGNNFVDKISGKLFPITGKDFDVNTTRGFPYKSTATISAPVGDATLIAADLNSYWYTAGTPNQIPVVSLFQDIDYEHKFFCRHMPQMVDANGVEMFEPRVADIVIYNTVKSGASLVECQVKFNVPVEVTANVIWVSKTGLDTNAGTKASPYLTIGKTNAAGNAGKTVYVKSGTFRENNQSSYLKLDYSVSYIALGFSRVVSDSLNYVVYNATGSTSLTGLIFDAENNKNVAIQNINATRSITINKCLFVNAKQNAINGSGVLMPITLKNSVVVGKDKTVYALQRVQSSLLLVDTCYFYNIQVQHLNIDSTHKNSKIITDKSTAIDVNDVALEVYGNKISYRFGSIHQGSDVAYLSGKTVNIHHNSFVNNSAGSETIGYGIYFTGAVTPKINNNKFDSQTTAAFTTPCYFIGLSGTLIEVMSNIFYSKNTGEYNHINVTGVGLKVRNNVSHGNSLLGAQISFGETSITGANDNAEFVGNRVIGHLLENPSLTGTCHATLLTSGINMDIRYNHISHETLGLVVKTNALPYTAKGVFYNKVEKCGKALWVRGCTGLNVFGNTFTRDTNNADYVVYMDENSAAAGTQNCENIILKNNIIKGSSQNKLIGMDQWAADHGCIAQNNALFGGSGLLVAGSTTYTDLATAQTAGKLLGCVVSDPLLDANLIPATPIMIAENLGVNYEDALDLLTNWGNASILPVIATKKQPTVGNWQVGAYVQ